MTINEIPLTADNQRFFIQLGGRQLAFTLLWRDSGWIMDIADEDGSSLLNGVPLVTGVNLLAPYRHIGLNGELWVVSDDACQPYPTSTNLGTGSHLWHVSP